MLIWSWMSKLKFKSSKCSISPSSRNLEMGLNGLQQLCRCNKKEGQRKYRRVHLIQGPIHKWNLLSGCKGWCIRTLWNSTTGAPHPSWKFWNLAEDRFLKLHTIAHDLKHFSLVTPHKACRCLKLNCRVRKFINKCTKCDAKLLKLASLIKKLELILLKDVYHSYLAPSPFRILTRSLTV